MHTKKHTGDYLNCLDSLVVSLSILQHIPKNEEFRIDLASEEASNLVSHVFKMMDIIHVLPKDITVIVIMKNITTSANIIRKKVYQIITELKRIILQSKQSCADLKLKLDETFKILYELYKHSWELYKGKYPEWHYKIRFFTLKLNGFLKLLGNSSLFKSNQFITKIQAKIFKFSNFIEKYQENNELPSSISSQLRKYSEIFLSLPFDPPKYKETKKSFKEIQKISNLLIKNLNNFSKKGNSKLLKVNSNVRERSACLVIPDDLKDSSPSEIYLQSPRLAINNNNNTQNEQNKKDQEKQEKNIKKLKNNEAKIILHLFNKNFNLFNKYWKEIITHKEKQNFLILLNETMEKLYYPKELILLLNNNDEEGDFSLKIQKKYFKSFIHLHISVENSKLLDDKYISIPCKKLGFFCLKIIELSHFFICDYINENHLSLLFDCISKMFLFFVELINLDKDFVSNSNFEEFLIEQSKSIENNFIVDCFILRALHYENQKFIENQVRTEIWNDCNYFRIQIKTFIHLIHLINEPTLCNLKIIFFQIRSCIHCIIRIMISLLSHLATFQELQIKLETLVADSLDEKHEKLLNVNIWEEHSKNGGFIWEGRNSSDLESLSIGSLNLLVQKLTEIDSGVDRNFLKTFITTYRSFTTPHQLFAKLLERYHIPDDLKYEDSSRANKTQLRVAVVIKYWLDTQFYDFDDNLILRIEQFCETLSNDKLTSMSLRLTEQIQAKVSFFHLFSFFFKILIKFL